MNSDPDDCSPVSADERWIDAALSEHARLGRTGADEELVLRILRATVHRSEPPRSMPRPSRDWRSASIALGAVAATVAVAFVVLSNLPTGHGERRSDELRFVVRVIAPSVPGAAVAAAPPTLKGTRHDGPMEVVTSTPTSSGTETSLSHREFEWVTEFGPTFSELPRKAVRGENLRITADRGQSSPDGIIYEGDVLVEHEQFRLEAASVRIPSPGGGSLEDAPLLAKSVHVVHTKTACTAEAENLRFDPLSGALVLTGVTRVATDKGELARFAPGDRLVLSREGFSVESAPVERYSDPVLRTR